MNLLLIIKQIPNQKKVIQLLPVYIYRGNLMIIADRIVIDSFISIAAGSVDRSFILPISNLTTPSDLISGPKI